MASSTGMRRNPKRKATDDAHTATEVNIPHDDLLREALRPLTKNDIREWTGWCELESEPAFFDALLSEYGVQNVKIQELINFDDEMVAMLPKPVFGLIFLFQYLDESEGEPSEAKDEHVWFANQTTDNACATLAMMNIVMNSPQVKMDSELRAFKEATQNLSSPLRGRTLDSNEFIRTTHNSLARRIDLLNSDLWTSNKDAAHKKTKRARTASMKGIGGKSRTKAKQTNKRANRCRITSDAAYHYIAYVTIQGSLWELDGLRSRPVDLGVLEEGQDVVSAARPFIDARCAMFGHEAVHFNVMGLCQSPLTAASELLAQGIREFEVLGRVKERNEHFAALVERLEQPLATHDTNALLRYGLSPENVRSATPNADFVAKAVGADTLPVHLLEMFEDLSVRQRSAMGQYRDEQLTLAKNEQVVMGRKQDSMPMVHRWLEALAGHGKLMDFIDT